MDDTARAKKHQKITAAAYDLLAEKGYAGTSMLTIARRARASNETLYRWYGDKPGLIAAMVRDNAAHSAELLERALDEGDGAAGALRAAAPVLLGMVLSDRAVLLNRAAAGDPSGELGRIIAASGRDVIADLVAGVVMRLTDGTPDQARARADMFFALLIADLQIRRCIGAMGCPRPEEVAQRSARAVDLFLDLLDRGAI